MNASSDSDQQTHDILSNPLEDIHPDRLALCFRGAIGSDLALELKSSERLSERINKGIKVFYALPDGTIKPDAYDTPDPEIAELPLQSLQELVLHAGIIYWSKAIAGAVLASDAAAVNSEIGNELYRYALQNKALSGPENRLPEQGTISARVNQSGLMCLSAWCKQTDPAIGICVQLKMPPDPIFDAPTPGEYRKIGPKIIRHVASQ